MRVSPMDKYADFTSFFFIIFRSGLSFLLFCIPAIVKQAMLKTAPAMNKMFTKLESSF